MGRLEKITEQIDEHGVVVRTAEVIHLRPMQPEPPYLKLYMADIGRLYGLRPVEEKILLHLASSVGYDGIVAVGSRRKAFIAVAVPCSRGTIDNSLSALVKAEILRRVGRGEFELDPRLFARGDWRDIMDRQKAFVASILYTRDGRRKIVKTEVATSSQEENESGFRRTP